MIINDKFLNELLAKACESERKRMAYDMRTPGHEGISTDNSQRILNALYPGTMVNVHQHPNSTENIVVLKGRLDVILYTLCEGDIREEERYELDADGECRMAALPKGVWHSVFVHEPSVIYEAKDGRYGDDGTIFLTKSECNP